MVIRSLFILETFDENIEDKTVIENNNFIM